MNDVPRKRPRQRVVGLLALALSVLLLAGACTSEESSSTGTDATEEANNPQVVQSEEPTEPSSGAGGSESEASAPSGSESDASEPSGAPSGSESEVASGDGCTLDAYGDGIESIDLTQATVGFSQSEREANPFRIAETQSIKDEAASVGVGNLLVTNANSELSKQISDIQDMLAQGAELLIVAPLNSDGLEPALQAAADQGVPVITIDRQVNAEPCQDYLTFIGSNFYEQGQTAAEQMVEVTGGEANVAILLGAPGNNVTTDRTEGFVDYVDENAPELNIVAQQTGQFAREEGQAVMEQLIQANPDINAVYAENDEMALGAVVALNAAGKNPGEDVKVVSIDGTQNAVQAIVDGDINAVVESNPRFGPLAFETAQQFYDGEAIPEDIIISDDLYTEENAAENVSKAY